MQSLETKSSRPRTKCFETESETRPETFETETSKNGSRDESRDRDQVSRLHHWLSFLLKQNCIGIDYFLSKFFATFGSVLGLQVTVLGLHVAG